MSASVIIAGETLELCAERAVWWPRRRILLVADPHFGKAAAFRALGVRVPRGTTGDALARLDVLVARLAPARIEFLGDFLHAREGRNPGTFAAIAAWRARHAGIEMRIVRGNHDRRAGDPPAEVGMACVDGPVREGSLALAHHPAPCDDAYVLAGHVHPCVVLVGRARQRERLPCFLFGAEVGVLPAFGDFTGCAEVEPNEGDEVWVVAADQVMRVGRASTRAPGA
ncbi:MAG TPA: ligase-associated DNA damage response endonuclease PdeM [Gemmatimonadaceae bacterium]|nr:ligase-associated DNA damage response endonuclease PdeM [Gemmatimonadaceae bacterium]